MKLQDRVLGAFGGGKDSAVLGQEHYGKPVPWRAWGESMAGHTLNLRRAECIFTLDRVAMPPVISLSFYFCSSAPSTFFTFLHFVLCVFMWLSVSLFFFVSNQNGFEFSTSLLNKLLPCSFFSHLLSVPSVFLSLLFPRFTAHFSPPLNVSFSVI